MNKTQVLGTILEELTQARDLAAAAADEARKTATDKENVAENKYDTLGLEAAYLAHGQSSRVQQLNEEIAAFTAIESIRMSGVIKTGSLVELTDNAGKARWLFIGPGAAGLKIDCGGQSIVIVTASSPAGSSLVNLEAGDSLSIGTSEYEVVTVM